MKLQGTIGTDINFAWLEVHFGQKNGKDFAQVSFPVIGDMNNDVDRIAITEHTVDFMFYINEFPCEIHMEKINEEWTGTLDLESIGMHLDLEINQISVTPDFKEHHYMIPKANIENLNTYADYDKEGSKCILEYELNNQKVLAFIKQIGIEVENHHDMKTAYSLMQKTCDIIQHDGVNYTHDNEHYGTIAQIKYAQEHDNTTNCRGIAIILAGVLRAYGFKANVVECWSVQEESADIHVVCEVYIEEYKKTVLLDPSSRLVFFIGGTPLSLFELREALREGRENEITLNEECSHNGKPISKIEQLAYYSKNLMILRKAIQSNESTEILPDNAVSLMSRELLKNEYPESACYTCNLKEFYV